MNRKYFILMIILFVLMALLSCAKTDTMVDDDSTDNRTDIGMNIIDSENNIKRVAEYAQGEKFKLEYIFEKK